MEQTGRYHRRQYPVLIASSCLREVVLVPVPELVAEHDDAPAVVAAAGVAMTVH